MAETDPPSPPPARPSGPKVLNATNPLDASRPGRPGMRPVVAPATANVVLPPPVVDAPPVDAVPTGPPGPPVWAGVALRRTLVPPCLVLGLAALLLGGGYFAQSPDAALRQIGPGLPVVLLVIGGVTLTVAGLLMASLRGLGVD